LHNGKRFRPNKKRTVAEREGKQSENEERDTGAIFQIGGSLCTKEKIYQLNPVEEYPTQIGLCVEPTTPCEFPRTEVRSNILSIVVSGGNKDSSGSNQSSGSSMSS
jgi:hypothetical protein